MTLHHAPFMSKVSLPTHLSQGQPEGLVPGCVEGVVVCLYHIVEILYHQGEVQHAAAWAAVGGRRARG